MQTKRACEPCRLKRRSCDKASPACGRCVKAGCFCPGYNLEECTLFLNYDENNIHKARSRHLRRDALRTAREHSSKANSAAVDGFYLAKATNNGYRAAPSHLESPELDILHQVFLKHEMNINDVTFKATEDLLFYEAMWNSFCNGYCHTEDYWPKGLTQLTLRSRMLDLALLALCSTRMSFLGYSGFMELGFEAYGWSVQLFRQKLGQGRQKEWNAPLACVSLVLALFEGSLLRSEDVLSDGTSFTRHLDGAVSLMKRSKPETFAAPAFHEVFVKIRELVIVVSVVRRQHTMFAESSWLTDPWLQRPKSPRDQLLDLSSCLSSLTSQAKSAKLIKDLLSLDEKIGVWQTNVFPLLTFKCTGSCSPRSCICAAFLASLPPYYLLIAIECRALQLMIDIELSQAARALSPVKLCGLQSSRFDKLLLKDRMQLAALHIEDILTIPLFRKAEGVAALVSEGRCRSILPSLALKNLQDLRNADMNDNDQTLAV